MSGASPRVFAFRMLRSTLARRGPRITTMALGAPLQVATLATSNKPAHNWRRPRNRNPQPRSEPVPLEAERRLDLDGRPYTREKFVQRHGGGSEGELAWEAAQARRFVEVRFTPNGRRPRFLHEQIMEFDGDEAQAKASWRSTLRTAPYRLNGLILEKDSIEHLLRWHEHYRLALNSVHIATCWHRLGVLASKGEWRDYEREWLHHYPGALTPLREHTGAMLPLMDARGVATLAHGAASVGVAAQHLQHLASPPAEETRAWAALFGEIERSALRQVDAFSMQELSSLGWSFAKAGHGPRARALFEAIAASARPRLGRLTPHELSVLLWSFATAGQQAPELFDALADAALPQLDSFSDQGLSMLLSSVAKTGHTSRRVSLLLDALAEASEQRLEGFEPQAVANTAFSLAKARHHNAAFMDALAASAAARISEYAPQEVAMLAHAFAELAHGSDRLFDAVAREVARRGEGAFLHPACRSMLVRAFERIGRPLPEGVKLTLPEPTPKKSERWQQPYVPEFE